MKLLRRLKPLLVGCILFPSSLLLAQTNTGSEPKKLTLEQCLAYALQQRPVVRQSLIDEAIGEREIKANLSGWFPQIAASFGGTHNLKLQQQPFGDQVLTLGRKYTSNVLVEATQNLFNRDLLLASKAAQYQRTQLDQNTVNNKINTVVDVSKAFYDVLLTEEQLRILDENLARQEKQYNDARSRYEVGLVDKTDYQRAAITLANIRSDRKRAQEGVKAKYAYLKQLLGYPIEENLSLAYDYNLMQQDVSVDTTTMVNFANRVELQQLETQRQLTQLNTQYYKWSFIPTVSAYINYNWLYFNNEFSDLYNQSFPTSAVGLQVSLPVFQGGRRFQNIKLAQLQEERLELDVEDTRKAINTEYQTALANYKSDYNDWITIRDNVQLAQEVYDVIRLQYDEGIKPYVDLIVAETDLRTTQLNYYNSLFNLLSSKLDYQRAIGTIDVN
ncbi:TolC family protein [Pontibacter silvestris]|uniref:TolC family protein n=1 Tax=Pontibacter silvestris TaxID=2305183 RepID=A0ABW4WVY9_9BACT|nr:TolC family protein [Pontibacter silvestris]MCC9137396.1 TolC family protein [Pontibacter silvestris]